MYRKCLIVFLSLFLLILSKLASSYSQTTATHPGSTECTPKMGAAKDGESFALQCSAP